MAYNIKNKEEVYMKSTVVKKEFKTVPDESTLISWIEKYPTKKEFAEAKDTAPLSAVLRFGKSRTWTELLVKYGKKDRAALRMAGLIKDTEFTIEDAVLHFKDVPAKEARFRMPREGFPPFKHLEKKYGTWENAREAIGLPRYVVRTKEEPHSVYLIYFPEIEMYKCGITINTDVKKRDAGKWKKEWQLVDIKRVRSKGEALIIESNTLKNYIRACPLYEGFKASGGGGFTEFFVSEETPSLKVLD